MKKVILVLIVLTVVVLVSCELKPKTPIKVEESRYVIRNIAPPKHVYLDVERISDGREFKEISLGKNMSNWRNIVIGDTITLKRYTYSNGTCDYTDFNDSEVLQLLTIKYKL